MGGGHGCAAGQVGNGAGHFQGAVRGAGAPAQALGGGLGKAGGFGLQMQIFIQRLPGQILIGHALPRQRALAGGGAARAYGGAAFARRGGQQLGGGQGGHFHVQVDAVQQRAGELALVAGDLVWRAAAGMARIAQVAARAGVHGGNELKARRKFGPLRGARDGDVARFQRLAQGFQRGAGEFGQLIQK